MAVPSLILVGAGARARAWRQAADRRGVPVAAVVARQAAADLGAPVFADLQEALAAHPQAAVLAALPPAAALDGALLLAERGRRGLVEAPLDGRLARAPLPPGAHLVRVAHGFATLPGLAWLRGVLEGRPASELRLHARGLPGEADGDLEEVLWHALAAARRLCPRPRVERARAHGDAELEVELRGEEGRVVRLRAGANGRALVAEAGRAGPRLSWEPGIESASAGGAPARARAVPPVEDLLLEGFLRDAGLDTLPEAAEVAALCRAVRDALGAPPLLGARRLRRSADVARRRPDDTGAIVGLAGPLPAGPPAPAPGDELPPELPEIAAFHAGLKPVLFLTLRPDQEEGVRAQLPGARVVRRERRVQVGPQDDWTDRRDAGEPRVELYASRDEALALRAAHLQADGDPSASLGELGGLMGYPACCVAAFGSLSDRSNNTRNRYATAARSGPGPWPWELNNLFRALVPFYPCRYTCEAALAWARAALAALERLRPDVAARQRRVLAAPVLYFDHARQLLLDGSADGDRIRYRAVRVPGPAPAAFAAFAGAIAAGDALRWGDEALRVEREGRTLWELRRTDPALGFLAPFA